MKKKNIVALAMGVFSLGMVGIVNATPLANIVYSNDFETPASFTSWSDAVTASSSYAGFGSTQYHGNYTESEGTTLTITGLGEHTELSLDFDLYLFSSWDGNDTTYGADYFSLAGDISGAWTFTNHQSKGQTYLGSPTERYGSSASQTQVYRDFGLNGLGKGITIGHTGDSFEITFAGPTTQTDEWWGIDNVMVSTNSAPVPEPATMLLFGTGLIGLVGSRLRKNKK